MLLVFDVGNTNMVIGIYKDKSLVKDWRICTDIHKTSDEYGIFLLYTWLFDLNYLQ